MRSFILDGKSILDDSHDEELFCPCVGQVVNIAYKDYVVQGVHRTLYGDLHVVVNPQQTGVTP